MSNNDDIAVEGDFFFVFEEEEDDDEDALNEDDDEEAFEDEDAWDDDDDDDVLDEGDGNLSVDDCLSGTCCSCGMSSLSRALPPSPNPTPIISSTSGSRVSTAQGIPISSSARLLIFLRSGIVATAKIIIARASP